MTLPGDRPQEFHQLPLGGDVADAIALIVAGSGTTTEDEIIDLLDDAYPSDNYEEIGVLIPVDKDLFTDTVQNVVAWYDMDEALYPVQTEGASVARSASKLGDEVRTVGSFAEILTAEEYTDWDEAHLLIAMPDDPEDPEYDLYAEWVEIALREGIKVRDLTKGLDDVVIADDSAAEEDEEPAPEPEPEPEKPARKSRAKKAEPVEEVAEVQSAPEPAVDPWTGETPVEETKSDLLLRVEALENRVETLEDTLTRIGMVFRSSETAPTPDPVVEAIDQIEEEKKASGRGRGRPRENFEVPQIFDEDKDEWVPRPKGRMAKGTEWRKIHSETGEILSEGTA